MYNRILAKKEDNWESGHDRNRVEERWRESADQKRREVKPQKQLLWMKLETLLKVLYYYFEL